MNACCNGLSDNDFNNKYYKVCKVIKTNYPVMDIYIYSLIITE